MKKKVGDVGSGMVAPMVTTVDQPSMSEQDATPSLSTHTHPPAPLSSESSLPKGLQQVELELRLLEALEMYHPAKLQGMHRHFVLFGLMEYLEKRLHQRFTADEILQHLDRFYNIEMLRPDEEEEIQNQEEEFSLPSSFFNQKEDIKEA
ncbi:hypothetical protein KP509_04G047500 [Ceratopteris richardii]|uniref:Uncharacterized protein n=1 Tax=Ceratopteris richardii TaxID=49495 RepID=A0A8T2UWP9_CERRI|nr:hypothetical protein KP509_04G047500 [Ceratopteris richardii]